MALCCHTYTAIASQCYQLQLRPIHIEFEGHLANESPSIWYPYSHQRTYRHSNKHAQLCSDYRDLLYIVTMTTKTILQLILNKQGGMYELHSSGWTESSCGILQAGNEVLDTTERGFWLLPTITFSKTPRVVKPSGSNYHDLSLRGLVRSIRSNLDKAAINRSQHRSRAAGHRLCPQQGHWPYWMTKHIMVIGSWRWIGGQLQQTR
jgi:hypothetical protein